MQYSIDVAQPWPVMKRWPVDLCFREAEMYSYSAIDVTYFGDDVAITIINAVLSMKLTCRPILFYFLTYYCGYSMADIYVFRNILIYRYSIHTTFRWYTLTVTSIVHFPLFCWLFIPSIYYIILLTGILTWPFRICDDLIITCHLEVRYDWWWYVDVFVIPCCSHYIYYDGWHCFLRITMLRYAMLYQHYLIDDSDCDTMNILLFYRYVVTFLLFSVRYVPTVVFLRYHSSDYVTLPCSFYRFCSLFLMFGDWWWLIFVVRLLLFNLLLIY